MLEVTFLNVNQGDSLILQWTKKGGIGTIIIDCHLTIDGNKTIKNLQSKGIKEIEYIILSHPHFDHFSGISELLHYCVSNNITIKYFLFTGKVQPEFIKKITKASPQAANEIIKLFDTVLDYYNAEKFILNSLEAGPNCDIKLNDELTLTILSPSMFEEQKFIKTINRDAYVESDAKNHPSANWLSTVLKIHTNGWYVLLTSDCYKETLIRLDTKKLLDDENKILKLGQSAHHGALSSHNNTFWNKRNRLSDTKILFSVGENIYKHPNDEVVKYFDENLFEIHSTNDLGLLKEISSRKGLNLIVDHLNTFGEPTQNEDYLNNFYGDQIFTIDEKGLFV